MILAFLTNRKLGLRFKCLANGQVIVIEADAESSMSPLPLEGKMKGSSSQREVTNFSQACDNEGAIEVSVHKTNHLSRDIGSDGIITVTADAFDKSLEDELTMVESSAVSLVLNNERHSSIAIPRSKPSSMEFESLLLNATANNVSPYSIDLQAERKSLTHSNDSPWCFLDEAGDEMDNGKNAKADNDLLPPPPLLISCSPSSLMLFPDSATIDAKSNSLVPTPLKKESMQSTTCNNLEISSEISGTKCLHDWVPFDIKCNYPDIGSIVYSCNGVIVSGLEKEFQLALLRSQQRPLILQLLPPTHESISAAKVCSPATSPTSPIVSSSNAVSAQQFKQRFRSSLFMSKYNHPLAAKLRSKVDEIIQGYLDCDWHDARDKKTGTPQRTIISLYPYIENEMVKLGLFDSSKAQGNGCPAVMTDSLMDDVREHIEVLLFKRIYKFTKDIGPEKGESVVFYGDDEERNTLSEVYNETFSQTNQGISDKNLLANKNNLKSCNQLTLKLATLRYVSLKELGLEVTPKQLLSRKCNTSDDDPSAIPIHGEEARTEILQNKECGKNKEVGEMNEGRGDEPGEEDDEENLEDALSSDNLSSREEWQLAMKGLCRATQLQSPAAILQKFVATVRMITHALNAVLKRSQRNLQFFCHECKKHHTGDPMFDCQFRHIDPASTLPHVDYSACELSADELMPALAWVIIQSNPPDLECALWICSEFRTPALAHGEEAYCLSQIQSAVEFCRKATAASLEMESSTFFNNIKKYDNSLKLLMACTRGDCTTARQLIDDEGADINCLSPDQKDNPLSACIRYNQLEVLDLLLSYKNIKVNRILSPCHGSGQRSTPLLIASQVGSIKAVLKLLKAGADRDLANDDGETPLSIATQLGHDDICRVLQINPKKDDLIECVRQNSIGKVVGYLMQTVETIDTISFIAENEVKDDIVLDSQSPSLSINLSLQLPSSTSSFSPTSSISPCKVSGSMRSSSPLLEASFLGNARITRHLLVRGGANVNLRNTIGETALLRCLRGSLDLTNIPDDSSQSSSPMPSFPFARSGNLNKIVSAWKPTRVAADGFVLVLVLLLRGGAKRDATDDLGWNAIKWMEEVSRILFVSDENLIDQESTDVTTTAKAFLKLQPKQREHLKERWNFMHHLIRCDPLTHNIFDVAKDKDCEGIKALILQCCDVNARHSESHYTALIAAVFNKDIEMVDVLLNAHVFLSLLVSLNSDEEEEEEETLVELEDVHFTGPLQWQRTAAESFFLHKVVDLDKAGRLGMTALHYAAQIGDADIVGRLLAAGASRHPLNERKHTPLDIALTNGHDDAANTLKYDPQSISICLASKHGDWTVLNCLLRQGVLINSRLRHETAHSGIQHEVFTPLIAAVAYGQQLLVEKLIQVPGIDVNLPNLCQQTPLMYAATRGDESTVVALLKAGADRNLRDIGGKDAQSWATERGFENISSILRSDPHISNIHEIIKAGDFASAVALFKQGVDPNLEAQGGETPLIIASKFNRIDIVSLLLKSPDIQVDHQDFNGRTALFYSAINGHQDVCVLLLRAGANRNPLPPCQPADTSNSATDGLPWSISEAATSVGMHATAAIIEANPRNIHIHDACEKGQVLIVAALLLQGCPPCYRDEREGRMLRTPLQAACTIPSNHTVVKYLLSKSEVVEGINELDANGMSALMIACSSASLESTAQLLRAGADRRLKNPLTKQTATDYSNAHSFSTYFSFLGQTFVISE